MAQDFKKRTVATHKKKKWQPNGSDTAAATTATTAPGDWFLLNHAIWKPTMAPSMAGFIMITLWVWRQWFKDHLLLMLSGSPVETATTSRLHYVSCGLLQWEERFYPESGPCLDHATSMEKVARERGTLFVTKSRCVPLEAGSLLDHITGMRRRMMSWSHNLSQVWWCKR